MAREDYVQVPADSTGKLIRNLVVPVFVDDGTGTQTFTIRNAEVQAVVLTNPSGAFRDERDFTLWEQLVLDELRAIRMGVQVVLEALNPVGPTAANQEVDLIELARSMRDEDQNEER